MNLIQILNIVQLAVSVLLIVAVLLQQRGVGLSATFGGEGNIYRTKRGIEKALFIGTIVLSLLFFGVAAATLIVSR
jgi:preprotein translocase subunit SecG